MINKFLEYVFYFALPINVWVLWVGYNTSDQGIQLLAIFNMILLSFGLLFGSRSRKGDK